MDTLETAERIQTRMAYQVAVLREFDQQGMMEVHKPTQRGRVGGTVRNASPRRLGRPGEATECMGGD